jgi:twinkle protein
MESEFLQHEPCPSCGSKDNLARYTDGHAYCFGCEYYEHAKKLEEVMHSDLSNIEYRPIVSRKINLDTCKKYNYKFATYNSQLVHVADYGNNNFKLRFKDKTFAWLGDAKQVGLFGENLFRDKGKRITIVEGELDCLSVSQVYGNQWPVVSLKNGAHSAAKDVAKSLEFLQGFTEVIICFDQDEPGKKAAKAVAELFQPGQAKIARLPLKDANEMLVAGKTKELLNCLWDAKVYRPDGIVDAYELFDAVVNQPKIDSIPYPFASINKKTHGLRKGELLTITAGTGIGKSQFCRELAYHLILQNKKIGYIALEENLRKSAEGLVSIDINTPLHLSTEEIDKNKIKKSFDKLFSSNNVLFYNHFGSLEFGNLLSKIRYLAKGLKCEYIVLDHISIVVSGLESGDERRSIDNVMTGLRSLVEETNIGLILVSHLRRALTEKGHEEGGHTTLSQLRGSAGIGQLSDMVIGLERNQQSEKNSTTTTVRILKNRFSGETGVACKLNYDPTTGRLAEHGLL